MVSVAALPHGSVVKRFKVYYNFFFNIDYLITVIIFNCTIIIGCPKFVTRDEWGARPPRSPPTSIGNNVSIQSVYSINDYKIQY